MPEYQTVDELLKLAQAQKKAQDVVAAEIEGHIKLEIAWLQTVADSMGLPAAHKVVGPTERFPMQDWHGSFTFLVPVSLGGTPPRTGGGRLAGLALDAVGTALMVVSVHPCWYADKRDGRSIIIPHPTEHVTLSILTRPDDVRSGMESNRQQILDMVQLKLREAVARHVGLEKGTF